MGNTSCLFPKAVYCEKLMKSYSYILAEIVVITVWSWWQPINLILFSLDSSRQL